MGLIERFNNRVRGTNLNGDWVPKAYNKENDQMDSFFSKAVGMTVINLALMFGFVVGVLYVVKHLFF